MAGRACGGAWPCGLVLRESKSAGACSCRRERSTQPAQLQAAARSRCLALWLLPTCLVQDVYHLRNGVQSGGEHGEQGRGGHCVSADGWLVLRSMGAGGPGGGWACLRDCWCGRDGAHHPGEVSFGVLAAGRHKVIHRLALLRGGPRLHGGGAKPARGHAARPPLTCLRSPAYRA